MMDSRAIPQIGKHLKAALECIQGSFAQQDQIVSGLIRYSLVLS